MDEIYTKNQLKEYGDLVEVGDYTYGCPKIFYWGESAKLKIGKFCSIAEGVAIFIGGDHRHDWITTYPFPGPGFKDVWLGAEDISGCVKTKGDITIGNDVWIGYGATIMSGVKIGDGAVIGAKALVTKDVEPYSIVGGVPAKIIKKRFSEEEIARLLRIKWWDWSYEKIKENVGILCSKNIDKLADHELETA